MKTDSHQSKALETNLFAKSNTKFISIGIAPRGIIAIGLVPMGVIAIGAVSMGIITFGFVGMGLVNACIVGCGLLVYGINAMSIN